MKNKKFYITAALPYASAVPHIGNIYEFILTDAIARYKRLQGYDVYFQLGTDEHGQKIADKAKSQNLTPSEFADKISSQIRQATDSVNISYDYFIRTTDQYHKDAVSNIVEYFFKKGDVYLGEYEGLYSKEEETYVKEKDLIDGKLPSGEVPIHMKEQAYFFKLSKYQDILIKHIQDNPEFIMPESRRNEMLSFLKEPLLDLCISRTAFDWGIQIKFDQKHVVYVWLDALTNYITGLGYDVLNEKQPDLFNKLWPCDLHVLGKDIARFHVIFWPIFLLSLGLPLPKTIFAHPWILMNHNKMSKSRGNVIYTDELIKYLGVDPTRYYCLSEIPYKDDGNLTYELVIDKTNTDLVNTIGNLLSRTLGMIKKYNNQNLYKQINEQDEETKVLIDYMKNLKESVEVSMSEYKVAEAINKIVELPRLANKYIEVKAPWVLFKEQKQDELNNVLYTLVETLRYTSILLQPFIPETANKILQAIKVQDTSFDALDTYGLTPDCVLEQVENLYQRIDKDQLLDIITKDEQQ